MHILTIKVNPRRLGFRTKYLKKKNQEKNNVTNEIKSNTLSKVVNSVSVGVLFFQLEWNVSVSECFGVPFRGCTVHIYIYIQQT